MFFCQKPIKVDIEIPNDKPETVEKIKWKYSKFSSLVEIIANNDDSEMMTHIKLIHTSFLLIIKFFHSILR
jgi:hypothetical protein